MNKPNIKEIEAQLGGMDTALFEIAANDLLAIAGDWGAMKNALNRICDCHVEERCVACRCLKNLSCTSGEKE